MRNRLERCVSHSVVKHVTAASSFLRRAHHRITIRDNKQHLALAPMRVGSRCHSVCCALAIHLFRQIPARRRGGDDLFRRVARRHSEVGSKTVGGGVQG